MAASSASAEQQNSEYLIKLRKPLMWGPNGTTDEINLSGLENLTAQDQADAYKFATQNNPSQLVPTTDPMFLRFLVSRATGIPDVVLKVMGIKDWSRVNAVVLSFLNQED